MNEEANEKLRIWRDRKEHRQEEHYKHDKAVPYKREPVKWDELLEEEDNE